MIKTVHRRIDGFTLVELILVIVILGLLGISAAPTFVNLNDDATLAKLAATEKAFNTGVQLAQTKWLVLGSPDDTTSRNDIQLYGSSTTGQVDVNTSGWPVQSDSTSSWTTTNSDADCLSLWYVLVENGANSAATDDSKEYTVNYEGSSTCSYSYTENTDIGFSYDSSDGTIEEFTDGAGGGGGGGSIYWLTALLLVIYLKRNHRFL